MKRSFSTWSLLTLLLFGQSHGQDTVESRARLSGLNGLYIYVEPVSMEMMERGMTSEVIHAQVERRLRDAGVSVLSPDSDGLLDFSRPTLYILVTALLEEGVEQCMYSIRVELTQPVELVREELSASFHAATWSTGGVGFHRSGWRDALIDDILAYVDVFTAAYSAANPDHVTH